MTSVFFIFNLESALGTYYAASFTMNFDRRTVFGHIPFIYFAVDFIYAIKYDGMAFQNVL